MTDDDFPLDVPEADVRVSRRISSVWLIPLVACLIAGWLVSVLSLAVLLGWSMFYVWRRRQYESLIVKLERELSELRNLPFTAPAPLEDLPEDPSPEAAALLAFADVNTRRTKLPAKAAE